MITSRHIRPNSFWGLVKQSGPWKTTTVDLTHEAEGYDSPHNQVQEVRPFQQDGSAPKLTWDVPPIVDPGNLSFKQQFSTKFKKQTVGMGRLEKFLTSFIGEQESEFKALRDEINAQKKFAAKTLAEDVAEEEARDLRRTTSTQVSEALAENLPGFREVVTAFQNDPDPNKKPLNFPAEIKKLRQKVKVKRSAQEKIDMRARLMEVSKIPGSVAQMEAEGSRSVQDMVAALEAIEVETSRMDTSGLNASTSEQAVVDPRNKGKQVVGTSLRDLQVIAGDLVTGRRTSLDSPMGSASTTSTTSSISPGPSRPPGPVDLIIEQPAGAFRILREPVRDEAIDISFRIAPGEVTMLEIQTNNANIRQRTARGGGFFDRPPPPRSVRARSATASSSTMGRLMRWANG